MITVERDGDYIKFTNKDGYMFYDIDDYLIDGHMYSLEEKTWFTPEVKAQVEALLDV
jgi:hypothetical protein